MWHSDGRWSTKTVNAASSEIPCYFYTLFSCWTIKSNNLWTTALTGCMSDTLLLYPLNCGTLQHRRRTRNHETIHNTSAARGWCLSADSFKWPLRIIVTWCDDKQAAQRHQLKSDNHITLGVAAMQCHNTTTLWFSYTTLCMKIMGHVKTWTEMHALLKHFNDW